MKKINIEGSAKDPALVFDPEKGLFELSGNSIPEDAKSYYQPVLDAIRDYIRSPKSTTQVNINLTYFNSATSKWLVNILREMKEIVNQGHSIEINWYYHEDDDQIYESGEDFRSVLGIPINLIQLPA